MKLARLFPLALVTSAAFACGGEPPPPAAPPPAPPVATSPAPPPPVALPKALPYPASRVVDANDTLFGTKVADPYRWLEDVGSDEVKKWMTDEDALARSELAKRPGRDAIAARLKELFYVDSMGVPAHRGARYFWSKREATKEKAIVYYKDGKTGADKVLLDPNAWSAGGANVSLGGYWPTWDGKTVAYKTKSNNSDEATMYLMDVATGKKSDVDVIEGAKYAGASWTPKGDGFYYTWLPTDPSIPASERPGFAEVRFHKVGTDPKKDTRIYEATKDPKMFVTSFITKDGNYLFVNILHGWSRTDVYFKDLRASQDNGWKPLATGLDAEFDVDEYKGRFFVRTNDGAAKYRLYAVDPKKPERAAWKEIVPERQDATLESTSILGGRLVLDYLKDVASKIEIHDTDGKLLREIPLPTIGSAGLSGRDDEDEAYLSFTSFTYPTEIHETSIKSGESKLWFKLKLPVEPAKFDVEQLFFKSKDGTRIPMFVVHGKDFKKDGKAPLLVYGYGGFKASQTPTFRSSVFPWLEHGGVYAIVNLRGGSEYGEEWHRAGMKHNKQNVFDDFEGAAEFLQKEGWSSPQKTAILGGSNGGLLVGAALTQRPELYRVVLCDVPLLDMVRYHKFGAGKTWIEEYGSADDEADFKAIYGYSPYHHVTKGTKYPSVLMLSADSDDFASIRCTRESSPRSSRTRRPAGRSSCASRRTPGTAAPTWSKRRSRRSPTSTRSRSAKWRSDARRGAGRLRQPPDGRLGRAHEGAGRDERGHRLDVLVERPILGERLHELAHARLRRGDPFARLERAPLIDPRRRRHDLDRQRGFHVAHDLDELLRADAPHAHVVFFSRRGRDRVHARRVAEHLVLADERRARDLRDHEARVQAAHRPRRREERREAGRERRVHQLLDPALADVRELGDGHGREIQRERERLAVEVAAGDYVRRPRGVEEDAGVVGDAVDLAREHVTHPGERVAGRAVHLRHAAERIGVLHLSAVLVALGDLALGEERAHVRRDRRLPRMRGARP